MPAYVAVSICVGFCAPCQQLLAGLGVVLNIIAQFELLVSSLAYISGLAKGSKRGPKENMGLKISRKIYRF